MTKEEMKAEFKDLLDWATNGYIALNPISEDYKRYEKEFNDLIDQKFDNPPLKFEELKEEMWVWDNKYKVYNQIYSLYGNFMSTKHNAVQFKHLNETTQWGDIIEFEENRFYRKEVK